MRRSRLGSAAVFAMVMVVSTAALAIVMLSLSGALRTKQTRLETNRIVQTAFDGGVDVVRDMAARGVLRLPQTVSVQVGSVKDSLQLADSSGLAISLLGINVTTSAPTILVNGTMTYNSNTYRMQRVIGRGLTATVWQFALYSDSALSSVTSALTTGSPGLEGDVWVHGNLTLTNSATHIGGNLTVTGLVVPPTMNVDGTLTAGATSITMPLPKDPDYLNSAGTQLSGTTTLNGYTFLSPDANGYPLVYVSGKLSISGAFTGSGTIYCASDMQITGDITTGVNDHVVIIAGGNITVADGATHVGAYIFSGKIMTISSAGEQRYFTKGVVANKVTLGDSSSFSFDPFVRDNPAEAYKLRLPGVWP